VARALVILVATDHYDVLNEVFQFAAVLVATDGSTWPLADCGRACARTALARHASLRLPDRAKSSRLWLVPLGISPTLQDVPESVGSWLIVGGLATGDMLAAFWFLTLAAHPRFLPPATIAEIWMLG